MNKSFFFLVYLVDDRRLFIMKTNSQAKINKRVKENLLKRPILFSTDEFCLWSMEQLQLYRFFFCIYTKCTKTSWGENNNDELRIGCLYFFYLLYFFVTLRCDFFRIESETETTGRHFLNWLHNLMTETEIHSARCGKFSAIYVE